MKKIFLVVGLLIMTAFASGCNNVSAAGNATSVDEVNQASTEEQKTEPPTTVRETLDESMEEGSATPQKSEANWQDFVNSDGVFNMDKYAEALGYTVIKADKSHSWYIMDTLQCHYCIVAYRDTLNIMLDNPDAGYGINVVDNYDLNERSKLQCIQKDTFEVSESWIEESSSLLRFIAANGSSEKEIYDFSDVKTLKLTCTKNPDGLITDERGVIVGSNGSSELFWKKNW